MYIRIMFLYLLQKLKQLNTQWITGLSGLPDIFGYAKSLTTHQHQMNQIATQILKSSGTESSNDVVFKSELPLIVSTNFSSGIDLPCNRPTLIPARSVAKIPTGVYILSASGDLDIQVRPRSSTILKYGLIVQHGTIDIDYKGEIQIIVYNTRQEEIMISYGTKIAQIVIGTRLSHENIVGVKISGNLRKDNGFGSTGS
jgi:dUTP pyrophosphatase